MNKNHTPSKFVPDELLKSDFKEINKKFEHILGKLTKEVGKPYYSSEGFILYNNDNFEILEKIYKTELRFDLTVTSPPYNLGKEYEVNMDVDDYISWTQKWVNFIYKITNEKGSFWLNLGHLKVPQKGSCVPIPYLIWDKIDFYLIQELVWNYGSGVQTKKRLSPRNEKWLFYVKNNDDYVFNLDLIRDKNVKYPNQKKNGKLRCNPLGKNPSDVWILPKVTTGTNRSSKERVEHPAQFPLSIINRLIKVSSNLGDLILDPFSGSGTTGISSVGLNRIYIGIEIDEKYCSESVRRFEKFKEMRRDTTRIGE
jgi:adenine-specific DNA-methyltransferase